MLVETKDLRLSEQTAARLISRRSLIIRRLHEMAQEQDLVLFETMWVTVGEAKKLYRRYWWQHWRMIFEIMVLYTLILGMSGFLGLVLILSSIYLSLIFRPLQSHTQNWNIFAFLLC